MAKTFNQPDIRTLPIKRLAYPLFKYLVFVLICSVSMAVLSAEEEFEADSVLAKRAAKRADELTKFVEAQFQIKLDYSDESIEKIDAVMDGLHTTFVEEQPSDAELLPISQGFGSYIGEVYRRNHKATWGWITRGKDVFPGLKQAKGGYFWPWAKSLDRIKTNATPNISDYYHFLVIR